MRAADPLIAAAELMYKALKHTQFQMSLPLYNSGTVGFDVNAEIDAALAAYKAVRPDPQGQTGETR